MPKKVKFKGVPHRASSFKSAMNYKSFFRNFSELKTADESGRQNSKNNRRFFNYGKGENRHRTARNQALSMVCLTPSLNRKDSFKRMGP